MDHDSPDHPTNPRAAEQPPEQPASVTVAPQDLAAPDLDPADLGCRGRGAIAGPAGRQRVAFDVEPDKKGKGPNAVNLAINS
jgi:hypothetical protein